MDPRYVDLSSKIIRAGLLWDDVINVLNSTSIHPLTASLQDQVKFFPDRRGDLKLLDVTIYSYVVTGFIPEVSNFKVHYGAFNMMCELLQLEPDPFSFLTIIENIKAGEIPELVDKVDEFEEQYNSACDLFRDIKFRHQVSGEEIDKKLLKRARLISSVASCELGFARAVNRSSK